MKEDDDIICLSSDDDDDDQVPTTPPPPPHQQQQHSSTSFITFQAPSTTITTTRSSSIVCLSSQEFEETEDLTIVNESHASSPSSPTEVQVVEQQQDADIHGGGVGEDENGVPLFMKSVHTSPSSYMMSRSTRKPYDTSAYTRKRRRSSLEHSMEFSPSSSLSSNLLNDNDTETQDNNSGGDKKNDDKVEEEEEEEIDDEYDVDVLDQVETLTSKASTRKKLEKLEQCYMKRLKGKFSNFEICIRMDPSIVQSVGGSDIQQTILEEYDKDQLLLGSYDINQSQCSEDESNNESHNEPRRKKRRGPAFHEANGNRLDTSLNNLKIKNQILFERWLPGHFCEYVLYCERRSRAKLSIDMARFLITRVIPMLSKEWKNECNGDVEVILDRLLAIEQCAGDVVSPDARDLMIPVPIPHITVVRIPGDNLVELIQANTLSGYVEKVCSEFLSQFTTVVKNNKYVRYFEDVDILRPIVFFLVEGLQSYLKIRQQSRYRKIMNNQKKKNKSSNRKQKTKENDDADVSEQEIEQKVIQAQLEHHCQIYHTKNGQESADYLVSIAQNLSESPYKAQTSVIDFRSGSSSPLMKYIYTGDDTDSQSSKKKLTNEEIWCSQLMEISSVSEKIAKSIVSVYPSVKSLLDAYSEIDRKYDYPCQRNERKQNMLKDIQCTWGVGEGSRMDQRSIRKVGPAASTKVFMVFNPS